MRPDFRAFKGNGVAILFGPYLQHSAKGSTWEEHKYLETKGEGKKKKYYYDDSYEGGRHLEKGGKKNIRGWYDPNTGAPVNASKENGTVSRNPQKLDGAVSKNPQKLDGAVSKNAQKVEGVVSKNAQKVEGVVSNKTTKTPEEAAKEKKNALKQDVKNQIEKYLSKAVNDSDRRGLMNVLGTVDRDAKSLRQLYQILNPNGAALDDISDQDATYILNSLNHEYNIAPKLSEVKETFKEKFKNALTNARDDEEVSRIKGAIASMDNKYDASKLRQLYQLLDPGGKYDALNDISDSQARSILNFLGNLSAYNNKEVTPTAKSATKTALNSAIKSTQKGVVSKNPAKLDGAVSKNPAKLDKDVSKNATKAVSTAVKSALEKNDIKTKTLSKSEINDLANRGIRGEFGNGQDRKDALGKNYQVVQDRINEILRGSSSSQKVSTTSVSSSTAKKVNNAVNSVANQKVSTSSKTPAKSYTNQELKDMADKEVQRVMQKVAEMSKKKKK